MQNHKLRIFFGIGLYVTVSWLTAVAIGGELHLKVVVARGADTTPDVPFSPSFTAIL